MGACSSTKESQAFMALFTSLSHNALSLPSLTAEPAPYKSPIVPLTKVVPAKDKAPRTPLANLEAEDCFSALSWFIFFSPSSKSCGLSSVSYLLSPKSVGKRFPIAPVYVGSVSLVLPQPALAIAELNLSISACSCWDKPLIPFTGNTPS